MTMLYHILSTLNSSPSPPFPTPRSTAPPRSAAWMRIKEQLVAETTEQRYISRDRFHAVCAQQGVTDPDQQRTLLQYLHDLGIVLYFRRRCWAGCRQSGTDHARQYVPSASLPRPRQLVNPPTFLYPTPCNVQTSVSVPSTHD